MSEQAGHKTWYVGDVVWGTATMVYEGSDDPHGGWFVCDCDPMSLSNDDEYNMAGDGNPQHTAKQIVEDHNRIPELEWEKQALLGVLELVREENGRFREALEALVEAADRVGVLFLMSYTATRENGLLDLHEALGQAEDVLHPAIEEVEHE